jgi:hypothetical protein
MTEVVLQSVCLVQEGVVYEHRCVQLSALAQLAKHESKVSISDSHHWSNRE